MRRQHTEEKSSGIPLQQHQAFAAPVFIVVLLVSQLLVSQPALAQDVSPADAPPLDATESSDNTSTEAGDTAQAPSEKTSPEDNATAESQSGPLTDTGENNTSMSTDSASRHDPSSNVAEQGAPDKDSDAPPADGTMAPTDAVTEFDAAVSETNELDLLPTDDASEMMLDMGLEDLLNTPVEVWSATKTKTTLQDAPAIITVVTQDDIQRYGYQSVAEILASISGFYVVDDHILPNLGIRGIAGGMHNESGNIKVLIDGVNVAFRSTGGNWLGPELIPLSMVETIEIIRGPASALYGADAFLGVVNIMTIDAADTNGARMIAGGSIDTLQNGGVNIDFSGGGVKNKFELTLAGKLHRNQLDGLILPDSSPAPELSLYNDDLESDGMFQKSDSLYARIGYSFNDNVKLQVFALGSRIQRGGEFSTWGHLSHGLDDQGRKRGTRITLQKGVSALKLSFIPTEKLTIDYNVSYHSGKPTEDDRIEVGRDAYYIKRDFGYKALDTNLETRWQIHESFTAIAVAEFMLDKENLPSSLRVLRTTVDDISAGDIEESTSSRQGDKTLYNIGALMQGVWTALSPWLSLTGGFRFDNHSLYGNQFSGRAGIISNPFKMLHIKLLYGSAFKAPSPLLLHGVPHDVGDIVGNPDLKPQKVYTLESQFMLKPSKYFSATTGVSYSRLKDKAEFVQRGINRVAENISEMNSTSWESELAVMYNEWIRANLGFEYQWTQKDANTMDSVYLRYLTGVKNEVYPQFIGRVSASGRIPGVPLLLNAQLMLIGPRPSSAMNSLENLGNYDLPSYLKLNATISTDAFQFIAGRDTVLFLSGKNLTNQQVADPGFAGIDYPIAPLTVMAGVDQHF